MTLTLSHDEALEYLASLETVPKIEIAVPEVLEEEPEAEMTSADKKRVAALATTKPAAKSKVYKPGAKQQKITQDHMQCLFKIANSKCQASSCIKDFAETFGYTQAYASSIVRKTNGMRLVKGRDIPSTDKFPTTSPIAKEQYIRKMI